MVAATSKLATYNMGRLDCALCRAEKATAHRHYMGGDTYTVLVPSAHPQGRKCYPFPHFWHAIGKTRQGSFVCSCEYGQIVARRRMAGEVVKECSHTFFRYEMDSRGLEQCELGRTLDGWALIFDDSDGEGGGW